MNRKPTTVRYPTGFQRISGLLQGGHRKIRSEKFYANDLITNHVTNIQNLMFQIGIVTANYKSGMVLFHSSEAQPQYALIFIENSKTLKVLNKNQSRMCGEGVGNELKNGKTNYLLSGHLVIFGPIM